jgi:hypothetical protein
MHCLHEVHKMNVSWQGAFIYVFPSAGYIISETADGFRWNLVSDVW